MLSLLSKANRLFIVLMLFSINSYSQQGFEKNTFYYHKDSLPYQLLKPIGFNDKDTLNYPLVVFLHGAGERGTDNSIQTIHIKKLFLNEANRKKYKCFIIAPQCPEKQQWVNVDWTSNKGDRSSISKPLSLTIQLIDSIVNQLHIDRKRIYITGVSMGGYGTWELITLKPNLFAAAIPICGGADITKAEQLKEIPIWCFHGGNDKVVPVAFSRQMINKLKEIGATPKYTEYKGVGHGSWFKAYKEPDLLKWLFEQERK